MLVNWMLHSGSCFYWLLLYSASPLLSRLTVLTCGSIFLHEWLALFIVPCWISTKVVYLSTGMAGATWLLPSQHVACTPYKHAPCHFMQNDILMVHAYLAVTCHLHFWQNDWGLLRATAVTQEWNGYRNKSTKNLPWRRKFSHRSCMDLNPWPFNHRSGTLTTDQGCYRHSNHWAILLPQGCSCVQRYNAVVCSLVKVTCMCFSAVNGSGPAYLSELLHVYTPSCTLCSSSDTCILKIQQHKRKTQGFRTFFCFGPHIWNSLPQNLRHCSILSSFKAKLKTFLFAQYFHPN